MAILPSADTSVQIDDNQPRRQGIGSWSPGVIGQSADKEGAGLERLGSTIGTVGDELQNSADQIQYSQAIGKANADLTVAHGALPSTTDPSQVLPKDPNTPAPAFQTLGKNINDARSMISNPRLQQKFDADMAPHIANFGVQSQARGRELNNNAGIASLESNTTTVINTAAAMDNEDAATRSLDGVQAQIAPLLSSGAMTPEQAVTFRKGVADQFVTARHDYLLAQVEAQPPGQRDYSKLNAFSAAHGLGPIDQSTGAPASAGGAAPSTSPGGTAGGTGTGTVTQGAPGALSPSGGPWIKGADGKTYATDSDGNVDTKIQPITGSATPAPAAGQVAGPGAPSAPGASVSTPAGLAAYKKATGRIESASGANEGALGSYYQFEPGTWAKHAGAGDTKGTAAGEDAPMNSLTSANLASLTKSLGREPTPAELYLAHQQGAGGAAALLANPNTPAGQLVPPSNIRNNGGDPNAPASQFVALWGQKYAKAAGQPWTPDAAVPRSALAQRGMPAPGAPSIAAAAAYRAGLAQGVDISQPDGGTQVASLGPVGLPVAPPLGLLSSNATIDDASSSAATRAPPQSQWPAGAQSVTTNADGTISYKMSDGSEAPVPGSRPTGAPHTAFPPPPQGSILSLLPAAKRAEMQLRTVQEIRRMQREDALANQKDDRGDLASITDTVKQMESGVPIGEQAWAPVRALAAGPAASPQLKYAFAIADQTRNTINGFAGSSPSDVATAIANMRSQYAQQINNPATAAQSGVLKAVIDSSQNYLKAYDQGVRKNPIGRAAMEGVIGGANDAPVKTLDPTSPTFGQDVIDRVQQAKVAAKLFGQDVPTYLQPEERMALRKVAETGGPAMVNLAKGVAGAGPDAYAMFKQIGKEAPPLAQIGEWALDPSADHSTQIQRYANWIAAENDPVAKKNLVRVGDQQMRNLPNGDPLSDAASQFTPDAVGRLRNTANIMASDAANTAKVDPRTASMGLTGGLPPDMIPDAYNESVGGTKDPKDGTRWGGITNVEGSSWRNVQGGYHAIVPTNMRPDKFETAIGQVNQSDIDKMGPPPVSVGANGGTLSAEDIKKGQFVAVPDKETGLFGGRYRVMIPDPTQNNAMQPVLNQNGKPWIFDMNRAQQNGLGDRVPGAFMPQSAQPPAPARGQFRNVKGLDLSPDVASADTEAP